MRLIKKMSVQLRSANIEDVETISRIEKIVYSSPWSKEAFLNELEKPFSRIWVLESIDEGKKGLVLGYAVFWIQEDIIDILNIAIDPEFQRKGLGYILLDGLVQEGRRLDKHKVILEVRISNNKAIQFYKKSGFIEVHQRKNFYSNQEDAHVFELCLGGV